MKRAARAWIPLAIVLALLVAGTVYGPSLAGRVAYAVEAGKTDAARARLAELSKLDRMSELFRTVSKVVRPAVVEVRVTKRVKVAVPEMFDDFFRRHFGPDSPFGPRRPDRPNEKPKPREREFFTRGLGSGVIVNAKNGYILTNHHVIASADEVEVVLADKRSFKTEWIRSDLKSDVAVIKIKADKLIQAPLGSSDKMAVGDWVLAIGAPEGLDQTVTAGIISAKGRTTGGRGYEDFLQTDAAINRGNSGGPLVNMRGEVIGINTAIVSRTGMNVGIGLAIPADMAKGIMDQLIKTGKVTRGYFGVAIQNVDEKLAKTFALKTTKGVLVTQVAASSPADKAGLKERDFIISVGGKETPDVNHLRNTVAALAPGATVPVEVYRDGKKRTLKVKIGIQPADMAAALRGESSGDQPGKGQAEAYGLTVQALSEELAKTYGYEKPIKGVVITDIKPTSSATVSGLRKGMVITHVYDKAVTSVAEFNKAMSAKDAKEGARVRVMTPEGAARFIFLTPSK